MGTEPQNPESEFLALQFLSETTFPDMQWRAGKGAHTSVQTLSECHVVYKPERPEPGTGCVLLLRRSAGEMVSLGCSSCVI